MKNYLSKKTPKRERTNKNDGLPPAKKPAVEIIVSIVFFVVS